MGRVNLGKDVEIINSIIMGPVIIGENAQIVNSYIGPFTSLSERVEVENSEIEYSIVMSNTQIKHVKHRMQNCLIGKDVSVFRSEDMPRVYGFVLADESKVRLI